MNGATNPPDAASTWIGMSQPFSFWSLSRALAMSATGSYEPSNVDPRMATTPIVFSSQYLMASSGAVRCSRPGASGT